MGVDISSDGLDANTVYWCFQGEQLYVSLLPGGMCVGLLCEMMKKCLLGGMPLETALSRYKSSTGRGQMKAAVRDAFQRETAEDLFDIIGGDAADDDVDNYVASNYILFHLPLTG